MINISLDLYRLLLTKAKYLDHTGRGTYRVAKLIEDDQTSAVTQKEADYFIRGIKLGKTAGVL